MLLPTLPLDQGSQQDGTAAESGPQTSGEGGIIYRFRTKGDYWELKFEGEAGGFRDCVGLQCIARLLEKPHRQIDSLDLHRNGRPARVDPQTFQPVADKEALAACRRRLAEYDEDIARAKDVQNFTLQEVLEKERGELLSELQAATGKGGRPRRLGKNPDAHMAADAIRKSIQNALKAIRGRMPTLYQHLKSSIRRDSTTFDYSPPQPVPNWDL
jgi:hypothetical protein